MPRAGAAEGVVVVDGPIAHIGVPDAPITLRVTAGRVTSVEGDSPQATELRRIVQTIPDADNIAEIGIGLYDWTNRTLDEADWLGDGPRMPEPLAGHHALDDGATVQHD